MRDRQATGQVILKKLTASDLNKISEPGFSSEEGAQP